MQSPLISFALRARGTSGDLCTGLGLAV